MSNVTIANSVDVSPLYQQAYTLFCAHRERPWLLSTFTDALLMPNSVIAQINGKCVGYALVSEVIGEFEIQDISVDYEHTRQGIASALLEYVIKQACEASGQCVLLEVAKQNINAQALYKKHGFVITSTRKNYYALANNQFDDALLMRKKL